MIKKVDLEICKASKPDCSELSFNIMSNLHLFAHLRNASVVIHGRIQKVFFFVIAL